jgi:hypothetical protein
MKMVRTISEKHRDESKAARVNPMAPGGSYLSGRANGSIPSGVPSSKTGGGTGSPTRRTLFKEQDTN